MKKNSSSTSPDQRRRRAGLALLLWVLLPAGAVAGTFTAFGPETYVRDTGAPGAVTGSFEILDPDTEYTMVVHNGGGELSTVSSAIITVNGTAVFGPNDFNQNVATLERPVSLELVNQISVEVRSVPSGGLAIEIIGVDDVPPTISGVLSPPPNAAGWNKTNVLVSFDCDDMTSGVASCTDPLEFSSEGALEITGTATDRAGNTATATVALNIDQTPPSFTTAPSPPPNAEGWNNTDVTVSFDCQDNVSGVVECPPLVVVSEEGDHALEGSVVDRAGNATPVDAIVRIDRTPPVISAAPGPVANANGWHDSDVTVSFTAEDALSGVAAVPDPLTLNEEGAGILFEGTASDRAGNSATASGRVNIDKTAPLVEILSPSDGTVFTFEEITVAGSVEDNLEAVDRVEVGGVAATVESGLWSAARTLGDPLSTIEVEAFDLAGNAATATVDVFFGRPEVPQIDPIAVLTNELEVTLSGRAAGAASVEIAGPQGVLQIAPVTNERFSADVTLAANRQNHLFFTGISAVGPRSTPSSIEIRHDAVPPQVFIDFPADGAELTTATSDVAGRVGDMLTGFNGLTVTVNGSAAVVDVGIGTNGTFFAPSVPLTFGQDTVIEVNASDVLGNTVTRQITVRRIEIPPGSPTIEVVSGNAQTGQVGDLLATPVVVRVLRANGTPFADKLVNVEVTRSDGRLSVDGTGDGGMLLQLHTDGNGEARAFWQLGSDSGCGNNRLAVTSADVVGSTFFCATANAAAASQVNVGSGNNQRGEAGGPLPEPLRVWVSDGRNGVPGVPVTFRVVQGDATLGGSDQATVTSALTGHAEVELELGRSGGNVAVEATFPGNLTVPAGFVAFAVASRPEQVTEFGGLVIDNANRPIEGADVALTVRGVGLAQSSTDADGQFLFHDVPAGPARVKVDGSQAFAVDGVPVPSGSFPQLSFDTVIVANASNTLPTPVLMPPLDPVNRVMFDNTEDVELTVEGIDGLLMTIRAGSMTLGDGTVPSPTEPVALTLNQVHFDNLPMPIPDGAAPPFAWTLQPAGAHFDPPVEVIYPNMSGLPAGSIAYFLSFNHDTGEFEIVASGSVTDDGLSIISDPGAGITTSGWGCNCPPYSVAGDCCSENRTCQDNGSLSGGDVMVNNDMPTIGDTITFTASGVSDSGGQVQVECPGGQEGTTTENVPAGSVEYEYQLSTPDGSMSGSGTSASVMAEKCGTYSVSFTAMVDRECPPSSITAGMESVEVMAARIQDFELRDGSRVASGDGAELEIVGTKSVTGMVTKDDTSKEWLSMHPMWSGAFTAEGATVTESISAPLDPIPLIVGLPDTHEVSVTDGCDGTTKSGTVVAYPSREKGFQIDFGDTGDAVERGLRRVPVFGNELASKIQFPNGVVQFSNKWEELDDPTVIWAFSAGAGVDPLIGWSGKITLTGTPDFILDVLGGAQLNLVLGGKIALVGMVERNKTFPRGSGSVTLSGGLTGGLSAVGALPLGIATISLGVTSGISGSGSLSYDVGGNDLVFRPKIDLGGVKVEVKYTILGVFEVTDVWMPIEGLTLYDPGKIILANGPDN